jgi:hypothetical protein
MSNPKNWQSEAHSFNHLSLSEAKEKLSYLTELDAELQGAIRICRNRVSALKDLKISGLRSQLDSFRK